MQTLDPLAVPLSGRQLIEASAGTGKTYTLATLYLRHVLAGRSVREILVVTFTVAATEELRERIRSRLAEALEALAGRDDPATRDPVVDALVGALDDPDASGRWLTNELTCVDEAAIFTIHGFCQRMLSEHAFESGALFDTEFVTSGRELLLAVAEDWWRRTFYPASPGLAAMAATLWGDPHGLVQAIERFIAIPELRIQPRPDPAGCDGASFRAAWQRFCDSWGQDAPALCEQLRSSKALGRAQTAYKLQRLEPLLSAIEVFVTEPPDDYGLPADFHLLAQSTLDAAVSAAKRSKGMSAPAHAAFEHAEALLRLCEARRHLLLIEAIEGLRTALPLHKQSIGKLAFDDLLSGLAASLRGHGGKDFARRIAARYPVAMIDEFQDTDAQQWAIFDAIYPADGGDALTLIGDPKQAIYSFRGADIYTYIAAKRATHAGNRYTLGRNWRSAKQLVDAVNALFDSAADPFLHRGEIDFEPVVAAGKADEAGLSLTVPQAPFTVWWLDRGEQDAINKTSGRVLAAQAGARGITALLADAGARIGERPLQPADIAVLVRTHAEGVLVQDALRQRRVASVLVSRESVFASEEAVWLDAILTAVAEPGDEAVARGALATPLMGYDASHIDRLNHDEQSLDRLVDTLQQLHVSWRDHGFMAMFQRWIAQFDVGARLARLGDGERRLTNLAQLAELIQAMSREAPGIDALLRAYRTRMAEPDIDSEAEQLRLESDEARVRIVTIHKSKGLEYGIVVLPFLWACRDVDSREPLLVHDPAGGRLLDLAVDADNLARARRERLAEDLRLAYVALTRARHACYLLWGGFKDAHNTALAWLLDGGDTAPAAYKDLSDDALRRQWQPCIDAAAGALALVDAPSGEVDYRPQTGPTPRLSVHTPRAPVRQRWRLTSYSGLIEDLPAADTRPDHGTVAEDSGEVLSDVPLDPVMAFPRGPAAGTCLHSIFETLDFPTATGMQLTGTIITALRAAGIGEDWASAAQTLIQRTLDTPLTAEGLRLRDIPAGDRLNEMEFHLRVDRLVAAQLEQRMRRGGLWADGGPSLDFTPFSGQIRGFIDLILRWRGRYYVVDYKSNWLGPSPTDYAPAGLLQAVAEHRYDLQYLLYTRAVHRFLMQRLPGYDYERDFGGVLYLFLRGLNPEHGPQYGVHAVKPDPYCIMDA